MSLQNCNLGQHVPLEKGVGRGGLFSLPPSSNTSPASGKVEGGKGKDTKESLTADPKANTRHGPPATPSQVDAVCKKILSECGVLIDSLRDTPGACNRLYYTPLSPLFLPSPPSSLPPPPFPSSPVPLLASLPTSDDFVADYTSPSDYLTPSPHQPSSPLSIIIYVVCKGGRSNAHLFQLLHTFSEILESSDIPESTRKRVLLQVYMHTEIAESGIV